MHQAADDRHPAKPWVDDETADEEDRHERHVEHRCRPEARQEAADLVEIADRLKALGGFGALEGHRRHQVEDATGQEFVEPRTDAGQHLAAKRIEPALQNVGSQYDQRETDKGGNTAAGQHAVVELEHVDRPGEGQDVDDRREDRHAAERRKAHLQGVKNFGTLLPAASRCLLHLFNPMAVEAARSQLR